MQKLQSDSDDPKLLPIRPFLTLEGGVLFHISESGRRQFFVPEHLISRVLMSAHNSLVEGHMGIFKTIERILANFFGQE